MYIVLAFISVVAAFCIMNTMITMAVQKRREIGMMRALGAKTSHVVALFTTKGFIVGLLGTGLGYLLGRVILYYRNDLRGWINEHFGRQIFDPAIYGLNEIPAELSNTDVVIICGIAFVLCTLAAIPPAFLVGRMEPAKALRNDR
jgi:lipoprotein-releasing system permease protein